MKNRYKMICTLATALVLVLVLVLLASCLHSGTTAQSITIRGGIKITSGNAIVRIDGKVSENLHSWSIFTDPFEEKNADNSVIREGSITKNETKILSAGEEYRFSILPTEVVTINVRTLDENDVELIAYRRGKEEEFTVKKTDIFGISIAFQNR